METVNITESQIKRSFVTVSVLGENATVSLPEDAEVVYYNQELGKVTFTYQVQLDPNCKDDDFYIPTHQAVSAKFVVIDDYSVVNDFALKNYIGTSEAKIGSPRHIFLEKYT